MVKEEKEITVPAFKVITVFDISQTEGKEFPDLSVKPLLDVYKRQGRQHPGNLF